MDWRNEEEYYDEAAFERYLINLGISPEQLDADLSDYLTIDGHPFNIDHCTFSMGEDEVLVYADDIDASVYPGGTKITKWLTDLGILELMEFWEDINERNRIKSLLRHPGQYHEWLVLAAIPELKAMGIPMDYILKYRTLTQECYFYWGDTKFYHGGKFSNIMHGDLLNAIRTANRICVERRVDDPYALLGRYLKEFAAKYYGNGKYQMPEALNNLIIECRNKEKPLYE